jgi:hypothetical protein
MLFSVAPGRNRRADNPNASILLSECNQSPRQTPDNMRKRVPGPVWGVVDPGASFSGPQGVEPWDRSSASKHCVKNISSPSHGHQHQQLLILNEEARVIGLFGGRPTGHAAFQGVAVCASGLDSEQPMMKARSQGHVLTFISAKASDTDGQSSMISRYQMTQGSCRRLCKPSACTEISAVSWIKSQRGRAHQSPAVFTTQYPGITCGDGNGDVKPDHPSGPGTYGHAV